MVNSTSTTSTYSNSDTANISSAAVRLTQDNTSWVVRTEEAVRKAEMEVRGVEAVGLIQENTVDFSETANNAKIEVLGFMGILRGCWEEAVQTATALYRKEEAYTLDSISTATPCMS